MRRSKKTGGAISRQRKILAIWASYNGTTGDAVRWVLARLARVEDENKRLRAELDALHRDAAIGRYLEIARSDAQAQQERKPG
jgi:hypothetical protein